MWVLVKKGSEKGSQKGVLRRGVSRRCPERPLVEHAPLGVHPIHESQRGFWPQSSRIPT